MKILLKETYHTLVFERLVNISRQDFQGASKYLHVWTACVDVWIDLSKNSQVFSCSDISFRKFSYVLCQDSAASCPDT